jgi:hypothetical protein
VPPRDIPEDIIFSKQCEDSKNERASAVEKSGTQPKKQNIAVEESSRLFSILGKAFMEA